MALAKWIGFGAASSSHSNAGPPPDHAKTVVISKAEYKQFGLENVCDLPRFLRLKPSYTACSVSRSSLETPGPLSSALVPQRNILLTANFRKFSIISFVVQLCKLCPAGTLFLPSLSRTCRSNAGQDKSNCSS